MTDKPTHRWIPATSKPGGLVFGDVVRHTSHPHAHNAVITGPNGPTGGGYWLCVLEGDPFEEADTVHEDYLLVRIDEPVPESGDAFRRGIEAAVGLMLEKASDAQYSASQHAKHNRAADSDDQSSYAHALEATAEMICERFNIPTPTEAEDDE